MADLLIALFRAVAFVTAAGVPLYAWRVRGRPYAIFSLVILAFSLPGALITHARLTALFPEPARPWLHALFAYCMLAAGIQLAHLVRARLRSPLFRLAVSVPGQAFLAAGFMAGFWLLALLPVRLVLHALGLDRTLDVLAWLDVLPLVVAALSIVTSSRNKPEVVRLPLAAVALDAEQEAQVARIRVERRKGFLPQSATTPADQEPRPLRIVQITDPHVGPWRPVERLHDIIEELLTLEPDLVLLTGDFLTMEGAGSPGSLERALAPLRRFEGRSFAIFGNHDHESPDEVRSAMTINKVRLLVDEAAEVETPAGPVQLVGSDYVGRDCREHLLGLLERFPRRRDLIRLLLLHDPLGFQHLPVGSVDLTLSGHTHGGQVGLVSLGFDWTVLSRTAWPDHGLFGRGSNRLYVHRGTGFYGFPLRVGVPGEASLLEILPAERTAVSTEC